MAVGSYIRLYWSDTTENYDIQAASTGDATFTINGDYERDFISGTPFTVTNTASNNASYSSLGAVYSIETGQTVITVAAVPADQGVAGEITMNQCFVEFEWALLDVKFSKPAVMDADRYGIGYRFESPTSSKKQKYALALSLIVDDIDMSLKSNSSGRPSLKKLLRDLAVVASTTFYVFHEETNTTIDGTEETERYQYTCHLDDVEGLIGSLGGDVQQRKIAIPFNVTADGTFTALGNLATLTNRTRP